MLRYAPTYVGYECAVRDIAGSVGLIDTVPDFSGEAGYQGAMRLLTQDEPPTASVALSDTIAVGVMLAAKELGVSIPRQVALVGSDNIEFSDFLDPPLTSINVPATEMGLQAMAMLEQLILDQPLENGTWCSPQNSSSGNPAGVHPQFQITRSEGGAIERSPSLPNPRAGGGKEAGPRPKGPDETWNGERFAVASQEGRRAP